MAKCDFSILGHINYYSDVPIIGSVLSIGHYEPLCF